MRELLNTYTEHHASFFFEDDALPPEGRGERRGYRLRVAPSKGTTTKTKTNKKVRTTAKLPRVQCAMGYITGGGK